MTYTILIAFAAGSWILMIIRSFQVGWLQEKTQLLEKETTALRDRLTAYTIQGHADRYRGQGLDLLAQAVEGLVPNKVDQSPTEQPPTTPVKYSLVRTPPGKELSRMGVGILRVSDGLMLADRRHHDEDEASVWLPPDHPYVLWFTGASGPMNQQAQQYIKQLGLQRTAVTVLRVEWEDACSS